MMCVRVLLAAVLVLSACAGSGTIVSEDTASPDLVSDSVLRSDTVLLPTDLQTAEKFSQEIVLDLPFELPGEDTGGPSCDAGEGCFLDPCDENSDCQSGWCVEHMGDSVCTISCQEECPAGWSCQQVAGTAPDLVFVCVSDVANLCKPCATGDNCKSLGGADVVCVDYGEEGSFCGGACAADTDCPWGFSCLTTVTVDGIDTVQCVADAGVCPCTTTSVKLALFTPCENANNWGTCEGMRVCEESGLSPCDALMPTEEACNGFDDDCDGDVDEESCDDENECTQDSCAGEAGCQYVPLEGGECKDGNPCTVADLCSDGVCVGTPVTCDDDDPCTDDSCDGAGGCVFEPNEEPCDDGDPCTVGDECNGGECAGITVPCDCQEDGDCEALEDGDLCNGTLYCDLSKFPYQCRVEQGTQINCPEPVGSDKPCLAAQCDPLAGVCSEVATNDGVPCDDELPCTVADICEAGVCTGGPATNCNDGNPCTNDSCQPDIGCLNEPILAPCSDLDACTLGDECVDGTCEPGPAADCDDGNVCTDDSCDPGSGCIHTANNAACSDGNACTDGDQCLNGDCLWSSAVQCDDGNPCTDDSCDPAAGCVFGLNDSPCDDGNLCTTGDFCHLGECTSAGSLNCDDGNLCTDDSCTLDAGCTFVENNVACDDDNACTLGDTCGGGWCVAGPPLQCGDDNPCTDDSCDSEAGCLYSFNSAPCSDSEFCTVDDQCALGECVSGAPLACSQRNPLQ